MTDLVNDEFFMIFKIIVRWLIIVIGWWLVVDDVEKTKAEVEGSGGETT